MLYHANRNWLIHLSWDLNYLEPVLHHTLFTHVINCLPLQDRGVTVMGFTSVTYLTSCIGKSRVRPVACLQSLWYNLESRHWILTLLQSWLEYNFLTTNTCFYINIGTCFLNSNISQIYTEKYFSQLIHMSKTLNHISLSSENFLNLIYL